MAKISRETDNLLESFSKNIKALKDKGVIRSGNMVGDIGEHLAASYYTRKRILPSLELVKKGETNVDAKDGRGKRYAIKSRSSKVGSTGTFHSINSSSKESRSTNPFDYLLVVILDKEYKLEMIIQLTWKQFEKHKKWNKTMKAWHVPINKKLEQIGRITFP